MITISLVYVGRLYAVETIDTTCVHFCQICQ